MTRTLRPMTTLVGLVVAMTMFLIASPVASAQDVDEIADELQRVGYYIESGALGTASGFDDLVADSQDAADFWYFVSLASPVADDFADQLRDRVAPRGNVLVYFIDGEFEEVQLASDVSESGERQALEAFDGAWVEPEEFMQDVVRDFDTPSASGGTSSGSTTSSSDSNSSSGGGFPWIIVVVPALIGGGIWFVSRRGRKKKDESDLETATKIRTELQTELDELANDVIVLSSPVDLSDKQDAITHYREATDTYLDISDEIPDLDKLEDANLKELAELGARVSHARWQMDACEAIIGGDPIPEKPKVAPPPPPTQPRPPRQQRRMPQRQARPRVQYSQSRRRSGGGLLDILIAGSGMLGGSRSRGRSGGGMFGGGRSGGGGMFGGGGSRAPQQRRTQSRSRSQSSPRRGGGVFGSGSSRSSQSRSRPSQSRSRSRPSSSRSRTRSSSSKSTSRRRRRGGPR